MDSEVYAIAQEIMEGSGEQLFDHIAKCLADFVRDRNLQDETKKLPLGFTFRSTSKQSTCGKSGSGEMNRWQMFAASRASRRGWPWAS